MADFSKFLYLETFLQIFLNFIVRKHVFSVSNAKTMKNRIEYELRTRHNGQKIVVLLKFCWHKLQVIMSSNECQEVC